MKKYIIGFLMGMFVCGLISVSAAKYLYKADEVSYDSKDTTWNVDNVDSAIKSLYSMINDANSALTNLKNTDIAKAVGANGNSFESVINQLGTIVNQGDKSFTISDTNGITIPAGYYNGHGTIKTSGLIPTPTATINLGNGTHDVTNYKYAVVNVPSDVTHTVQPYVKLIDTYSGQWDIGLIVDGNVATTTRVTFSVYTAGTMYGANHSV